MLFNSVNLDKSAKMSLTSDQKLDQIFKMVEENKSQVEILSSTVSTLKQSHDDLMSNLKEQIRQVCLEYSGCRYGEYKF